MDRRNKSRIDVQLTCYVAGGKLKGAPLRALTENISRTGILVRWMDNTPLPPVERKLVIDLQMPENSEFEARMMRCHSEVARVSPRADGGHEVALRILSMRFVKNRHTARAADLASMPVATGRVS